jgi:very-short-patch-repair endonuclease
MFLDLCRAAGLPLPAVNATVEGFEVDMLWPEQKLIVELDSQQFHLNRAAFERDRERDAVLRLAGYQVYRVTYRRLTRSPAEVADTVHRFLLLPPALAA